MNKKREEKKESKLNVIEVKIAVLNYLFSSDSEPSE